MKPGDLVVMIKDRQFYDSQTVQSGNYVPLCEGEIILCISIERSDLRRVMTYMHGKELFVKSVNFFSKSDLKKLSVK